MDGRNGKYMQVIGVYNADGSIIGEIKYLLGKMRGTAHCALCDITHRGVSKKREWKELEAGQDFDFELLHLDEQDDELRSFTEGRTPCVLTRTEEGFVMLLGDEELEECGKSVEKFSQLLVKSSHISIE